MLYNQYVSKLENLITSINPNALQEINRTVTPSDLGIFGNEDMRTQLREKAERLVGNEALKFLADHNIEVETYDASTNAFGKVEDYCVFGFRHMDRVVFFHPAQTEDRVRGVAVDYWLDDKTTNPVFDGVRFQENREQLGTNTLAFLRFLGKFVEKIDNNLIVNPSDSQRERLYISFFQTHGPPGRDVYVKDQPILKQKATGPEHQIA